MERARSALFPRVHSQFEEGEVVWVKVYQFQAGPFFFSVVAAENQTHQDLVKTPGYWKTCFKLEKMAEK